MKAQSAIIQFILFFIIGLAIFVSIGSLFKYQSDILKGDIASASRTLLSNYISAIAVTEYSTCKQCDFINTTIRISNTTADYLVEIRLVQNTLSVITQPSIALVSSLSNLNYSLTFTPSSTVSTQPIMLVYDRGQNSVAISSRAGTITTTPPTTTTTPPAQSTTITITSALSLSNYQILAVINTASLISSGKMRSDCGDMRFTDSDGSTQLNYWLESGCNTASTNAWVKVPSIPSGSKTIYVNYGNPSLTSASNGGSTFVFFDDFTGTKLDSSKWNNPRFVNSGTSASVHDSLLDFNVLSGYQWTGGIVLSKSSLPTAGYAITARVKFTNYYSSAYGAYAGFTNAANYESYYGAPAKIVSAMLWDYPYYSNYLLLRANDISSYMPGASPITIRNIWFGMTTAYIPTTYAKGTWKQLESPFATQTLQASGSGGIAPTYVAVGIGDYNTAEHTYFDYVYVRSYASSEPTVKVG